MKASDLYGSRTLAATDFSGGPVEVTIERVTINQFEKDGQLERPKPLIYFVGVKKALSVNATNAGVLIDEVGDDMDLWIGVKLKLGTKPCMMRNERKLGVRILEIVSIPPTVETKSVTEETKNGEAEKLPARGGRGKAGA